MGFRGVCFYLLIVSHLYLNRWIYFCESFLADSYKLSCRGVYKLSYKGGCTVSVELYCILAVFCLEL
jgi:hypothetical protein